MSTQLEHERSLDRISVMLNTIEPGLADRTLCAGGTPITIEMWKSLTKNLVFALEHTGGGRMPSVNGDPSTTTYSLLTIECQIGKAVSAYQRISGNYLTQHERSQLTGYIRGELKPWAGLSTAALAKTNASKADFVRIVQTCYSPAMSWRSSRERSQFVFQWLQIA
ncbi:hypothetical protein HDU89_000245 [Geranomyces variabilis]|nr:hypothetical protein HDU89_000245 [Geranomyces variabilis]